MAAAINITKKVTSKLQIIKLLRNCFALDEIYKECSNGKSEVVILVYKPIR